MKTKLKFIWAIIRSKHPIGLSVRLDVDENETDVKYVSNQKCTTAEILITGSYFSCQATKQIFDQRVERERKQQNKLVDEALNIIQKQSNN